MRDDVRQAMEKAGFAQASTNEPGIYVRRPGTVEKNSVDWMAEPTELMKELAEFVSSRPTQTIVDKE